MKLLPKVKEAWLAALRDPNAQQTKARLTRLEEQILEYPSPDSDEDIREVRPVGQCCLGVLCDLAAEAGIVHRQVVDNIVSYNGEEYMPPVEVVNWAFGLNEDFAPSDVWRVTNTLGHWDTLAELNDEADLTFLEIADVIEREM